MVGHPSHLGGADTELDHQIRCWLAMGVEVHLCHTGSLEDNADVASLKQRGCVYHTPEDWASLEGLHCISFCNSEFLNHLPEIHKHARSTTFVNCMSWNFDKEIECQEQGLIDFHMYQTQHSFEKVSEKLRPLGTYRPLFFRPYFDTGEFPFVTDRPGINSGLVESREMIPVSSEPGNSGFMKP